MRQRDRRGTREGQYVNLNIFGEHTGGLWMQLLYSFRSAQAESYTRGMANVN